MARHDLRCTACGTVHRDVDIPISQGARAYCLVTVCDCHPQVQDGRQQLGRLEPVPAIRLSLFKDGGPTGGRDDFQKFTLPVEDPASPTGFRDVTIGSLSDIRRLERESERAEQNGEGRRMIWRDYSQDGSNRDRHTIAPDPSLTPDKTFSNGTPVRVRRGDPVIADHGAIPDHEVSD